MSLGIKIVQHVLSRLAPRAALGVVMVAAMLAVPLLRVSRLDAQVPYGNDHGDDVTSPSDLLDPFAHPYQDEDSSQRATDATPERRAERQQLAGSDELNTQDTTLSANQIIALIHQRPEVAIDIKHVMAEFAHDHGIAIQEDSITDESLFSNLALNRQLRRDVSIWLRARGYVDDQQFSMASRDEQMLGNRDNSDRSPGSDKLMQPSIRDRSDELLRVPNSELIPDDPYGLPRQRTLPPLIRDPATALPNNEPDTEEREQPRPLRRDERTASESKEEPSTELLHQPTPYNLQSLRDLYTQLPDQTASVKPFGFDLFVPHPHMSGASRDRHTETPIDLPIGPDYVLGPGDAVTISVWGGLTQSFTRVISPDGSLILPEAAPVQLAGLTLAHAESLIQHSLADQFRDARVLVSIARLRTIRIYVVGDVAHPGAYDISSLSTSLNALYAAGGPTRKGSLRHVRHMRGQQLVQEIDLYEFLRDGLRTDTDRLQSGDTILVPPIGATATVAGMVKRPAIYELTLPATLAQVVDEAGGLKPDASVTHIRIERIEADGHRSTTEIELSKSADAKAARDRMNGFAVRDGDRIIVAPVLPYSEAVIYTTGHFARPGRLPFHQGMTLTDVIHSYQDLLPEPAITGEIIRLMPPDLHPEAIDFNIHEQISSSNPSIRLQPFDTILVRGRYDSDAPRVTIRGEVIRPGSYALTDGMTAAQLVRIAGGFKRSALLQNADLTSYEVHDSERVVGLHRTVAIGEAVVRHDERADVKLLPGDVLTIQQITGWNDIGASVTLLGEVVYPGTYGIREGETLSTLIQRAGGFRTTAYPEGAVMVRLQVKQFELKSRGELIRQIETVSAGARLGSAGTDTGSLQLLVQQQNQILQRLRTEPVVGRLVININSDLTAWQDTPADIQLRAGDVISIPKRPGFVLVTGQAYNTSAIAYAPGKDAGWYLRHAGGATDMANRKEVYVIRANGLVVGRRSGEWYQSVLSTHLNPGDVVVVPQKIVGGSTVWKNTLAAAQVVSSIAFTAALALR